MGRFPRAVSPSSWKHPGKRPRAFYQCTAMAAKSRPKEGSQDRGIQNSGAGGSELGGREVMDKLDCQHHVLEYGRIGMGSA
eukprot:5467056-Heterocapsa_arctica.AAC.1